MPNKLTFALGQYAALAIVIGACWGFGSRMLRLAPADARIATGLAHPMAITFGLGLSICLLQGLGIAGMLRGSAVTAILAAGWLFAVRESLQRRRAGTASLRASLAAARPRWHALPSTERWAVALLAACLLSTLIAPLAPPLVWDELMYHLPHAQQWAASGRIEVTPWLRYPWFPYNYDLLYAAALLFGNDVLPHLLHAAAGWLTAWLVYALGREHLDRVTACIAAALWVHLTRSEYQAAYVDMGVALFVTAACVAFLQWRGTPSRSRYWLLAWTLALGVAAGSKYQVLGLLPLFAVALLWHDRRPASWLVAIGGLALPCAYWYVRNAVLADDPFSPLGGPIFGFTDWNLSDHRNQFEDLRSKRGLPDVWLWAALLAPWAPVVRRSPAGRAAIVAAIWMLVVWAASSMYPRYLLSAYPVLALLSAAGGMHLARSLAAALPPLRRIPRAVPAVLLLLVALSATATNVKFWKRVAATPAQRDAVLTARVPGYPMWQWLRQQSPRRKIFQIGLEDSIYYAPQPIWGEVFGPWRYRDITELTPAALHARLAAEGFDTLVVHTQRMPQVTSRPGFDSDFILLHAEGPVSAYRLATSKAP